MFCDRLKEVRKLQSVTQADLASALDMSRQAIIKYESGERFPDEITLIKIADYFNVGLDYLLDRNVGVAERIATTIVAELNKHGQLSELMNDKIELVLNMTKALIIEFDKLEKKKG